MSIHIEDIDATAYGKYTKIYDRDSETWYYHECFIVCLIMAWLGVGGINYERYK